MAPTTGERIARVEEQVVNLGKVIEGHHVELTSQIDKLTAKVETGHLTNYRVAEMEDKVNSLHQCTKDLLHWREGVNGKIAMLLGIISFLIVAAQVVAAFI